MLVTKQVQNKNILKTKSSRKKIHYHELYLCNRKYMFIPTLISFGERPVPSVTVSRFLLNVIFVGNWLSKGRKKESFNESKLILKKKI